MSNGGKKVTFAQLLVLYWIMSLANFRGIFDAAVNFITSPVTEMVCAFILDISRNYLIALTRQFMGNQLISLILQSFIVTIPWIMLGHGAIRYPQNTNRVYSTVDNNNPSSTLMPKKNLYILTFLSAIFIFTDFFPL